MMKLTELSNRPCTCCKGTGINKGWTSDTGELWPDKPCYACEGKGTFEAPDFKAIFEAITKLNKTTGKRSFRKSKPHFENEYKNRNEGRQYFVWRMVRFHGGADVTMPVCATSAIHGDPFFDELDYFASYLAKRVFGTDMAAAYRWTNALGGNVTVPDNMPASAFSCGPVCDEHKPDMELMELH